MKSEVLIAIIAATLLGCGQKHLFDQNQVITFQSEDDLQVTADLYPTANSSDPIILMFHQSTSSRGEYQTIAPRLQQRGFNCLAVDLRWGKKDFWNDVENETGRAYGSHEIIDAYENTEEFTYGEVWPRMFDSYKDMKAAVAWVRANGFDGELIVWGSSFSAMLQFQLADELGDEVAAMVSYSPGEYYGKDTTMLSRWSSEIRQPVYIAAGKDTSEYLMTKPIFETLQNGGSTHFQAINGRHGSSMLMEDEQNWPSLISFLSQFKTYDSQDYLNYARQAGYWLESQKVAGSAGSSWPDDMQEPDVVTSSISSGVSGKVLYQLELFNATNDQKYLAEAKRGADYLLANLPQKTDSLSKVFWAFSAYGNVCGSGYTLGEMYKATGDDKYKQGTQRVLDILDHFAQHKTDTISWDLGNDVLSGLSGTGLFLLYAAEVLESPEALEMAISAGRTLVSRAIRKGDMFSWKRGQNGNFILPNFSHGPAGIGYFLARLYEETQQETFLNGAQKAISYLDSIAYTEQERYLIPYGFPDPGWSRQFDIGWAHGPAGVARIFYQMHKLDGDQKWLSKIEACFNGILLSGAMETIHPMFGTKDFSIDQRFGLASVASFCFDIYGVTKDKAYLNYGLKITDYVLSKASFKDALHWPIERFGFMRDAGSITSFTGYFYGSAGYGMLLLKAHYALNGNSNTIRFVDDPY